MKNDKLISEYESDVFCFEEKIYSKVLPSKKWYSKRKNMNNGICKDNEFESIYNWLKVDEKESSREYRDMVNEFRIRNGVNYHRLT